MSEPSDGGAIDDWNRGNPARRCTAHKKTGEQCRRWAIRGGTVCTHHGGNTPAVKAKARRRLEEAADRLAKQLLDIAEGAESEQVRLSAVKDALDRAGLKPPTQVDVAVGHQPWRDLVENVTTMTRAESRSRRGVPDDTPRWTPPTPISANGDGNIVDAEVVEAPCDGVGRSEATGRGNPPDDAPQPGNGLMTLAEANAELRDAQRRHNEHR